MLGEQKTVNENSKMIGSLLSKALANSLSSSLSELIESFPIEDEKPGTEVLAPMNYSRRLKQLKKDRDMFQSSILSLQQSSLTCFWKLSDVCYYSILLKKKEYLNIFSNV